MGNFGTNILLAQIAYQIGAQRAENKLSGLQQSMDDLRQSSKELLESIKEAEQDFRNMIFNSPYESLDSYYFFREWAIQTKESAEAEMSVFVRLNKLYNEYRGFDIGGGGFIYKKYVNHMTDEEKALVSETPSNPESVSSGLKNWINSFDSIGLLKTIESYSQYLDVLDQHFDAVEEYKSSDKRAYNYRQAEAFIKDSLNGGKTDNPYAKQPEIVEFLDGARVIDGLGEVVWTISNGKITKH